MTTTAAYPTSPAAFTCENCGHWFAQGMLSCPNCGALVYRRRLEQLSAEAMRMEAVDPMRAAMAWRQCLDLLPPQSQQYQAVAQRIGALSSGLVGAGAAGAQGQAFGGERRPGAIVKPPDAWYLATFKTVGSMLLSILCYTILWNSPDLTARLVFAAGFTVLILVHEFGHVIAMKFYKLSASPPIFIPFLGAVINMRQSPKNAWVEAVVGIGGPALGTVGVLVAVVIYAWGGLEPGSEYHVMAHHLAYFGVMINLFNLLPFPPLDGGRISAVLSPWMWLTGVAGLGVLLYKDQIPLFLAALLVFMGLPRIVDTLRDRQRRSNPYYAIPASQSITMAVCYAALAALLTGLILWLGKPGMFQ